MDGIYRQERRFPGGRSYRRRRSLASRRIGEFAGSHEDGSSRARANRGRFGLLATPLYDRPRPLERPRRPPGRRALPAADVLYWGTAAVGAAYLALSGFAAWRRRAANLTPVDGAEASGVRPDFLRVDHDARSAALVRGEAFATDLDERERAESARRTEAARRTGGGFFAGAMSVVTLVSMVAGSLLQVRWIGKYAEDLTAQGRLAAIVRSHPYAFAVAVVVVVYQLWRFVSERRWESR